MNEVDKNGFGPELKLIMTHMCNMIGVDYDDVDFKKQDWFWEHTWTMEKEEEFVDWLAKLLYNDIKVRKAILSFPSKDKERCKAGARFFASNFGWKILTEDLDKLNETK
jgi:hypothetical protein